MVNKYTTGQKFEIIKFVCSPRLHLFDKKKQKKQILLQFKRIIFSLNIF